MRIVVDTSVVVAAAINPGGAASVLLELVLAEDSPFESCLSLILHLIVSIGLQFRLNSQLLNLLFICMY